METALREASQRGVKIIINTNSPKSTDSLLTQAIFNEEWNQVMKKIPSGKIFAAKGPSKLHAKVFTFDGRYSIVGSYNMDYLSESINSEIAVLVDSTDFAMQINGTIEQHMYLDSVEYFTKEGIGAEQLPDSEWSIRKLKIVYFFTQYMRELI